VIWITEEEKGEDNVGVKVEEEETMETIVDAFDSVEERILDEPNDNTEVGEDLLQLSLGTFPCDDDSIATSVDAHNPFRTTIVVDLPQVKHMLPHTRRGAPWGTVAGCSVFQNARLAFHVLYTLLVTHWRFLI
jgi:hypothetical protein